VKGIIILVSLVIIVQMAYMAAAQPSGVWVLTNTTTDNRYTEVCGHPTNGVATCTPSTIGGGSVANSYTSRVNNSEDYATFSYTATWTVPPSVMTPGMKLNFGLGATIDRRQSGIDLGSGVSTGMQYEIGDGSWNYMQDNAHISVGTGSPTHLASSTFNWDVPDGNIGDVLKIRALTAGAYVVDTYYTYTYQAASSQPATATNAPPQQLVVDHVAIIPSLSAPSSLINNDVVFTIPSNRNMSPLPITFNVQVTGSGNSQVPDGTSVHFDLIDMGMDGRDDIADASITPRDAVTTNSEVTLTFTPPTDAYWKSHNPSAVDTSLNTMRIVATCGGKEWIYKMEMKPYPEPSIGSSRSTTGSTTGSTTF